MSDSFHLAAGASSEVRGAGALAPSDEGWKPIATAPKDGTAIDVWVKDFEVGVAGAVSVKDVGRYPDVQWAEEQQVYANPYERRTGAPGWVYKDGLSSLLIESGGWRVTHWMPLPQPPARSGADNASPKPDEGAK